MYVWHGRYNPDIKDPARLGLEPRLCRTLSPSSATISATMAGNILGLVIKFFPPGNLQVLFRRTATAKYQQQSHQ